MKKYFFVYLLLLMLCLSFIIPVYTANAKEVNDSKTSMEQYLQENVHYYDSKSLNMKDSIILKGEVRKILKADDPKTKENEEKIEKYQSNLVVAFVDYELVRDSIFYIEVKDFLYYDIDRKEFLLSGNVMGNDGVKTFFDKHINEVEKGIKTSSQLLFTFILFLGLFVAVIFMLVQEARYKPYSIYTKQKSATL